MSGAKVTGDFEQLAKLIKGMSELRKPAFRRQANRLMGEEALALVLDGFEHSVGPYGNRWPKPKHRDGKPLEDTTRLRNSIHDRSSLSGFALETNVEYAAIHQFGGTVRHPARNVRRHPKTGQYVSHRRKRYVTTPQESYLITIPARQYLPTSDRGFPKKWTVAFADILTELRRSHLGR